MPLCSDSVERLRETVLERAYWELDKGNSDVCMAYMFCARELKDIMDGNIRRLRELFNKELEEKDIEIGVDATELMSWELEEEDDEDDG